MSFGRFRTNFWQQSISREIRLTSKSEAEIGQKTFVGFNSFLFGKEDARLTIGKGCIVMPHTIIDITSPLEIPDNQLIWGFIGSEADLKLNSIAIDSLNEFTGTQNIGDMTFSGKGRDFVGAFSDRIEHILEANRAYCDEGEKEGRGHAQDGQSIAYSTLQPYSTGENEGLYPSIRIRP